MAQNYQLAENVPIQKTKNHCNIYVTKDYVYVVSLDKGGKIAALRFIYFIFFVIGLRFGLLGAFVILLPASLIVEPLIRKQKAKKVEELRDIDESDLADLPGFGCRRSEVTFEERKRSVTVNIGEDHSISLDFETAENLDKVIKSYS